MNKVEERRQQMLALVDEWRGSGLLAQLLNRNPTVQLCTIVQSKLFTRSLANLFATCCVSQFVCVFGLLFPFISFIV